MLSIVIIDNMKHKLTTLFKTVKISYRLGATAKEKLHMVISLLTNLVIRKIFKLKGKTKTFLISTHLGKNIEVELKNEFSDLSVLDEIFNHNPYLPLHFTSQPEIIFDLGSNVGFSALYFHARFPNAKIFCFEPDPNNFSRLINNTKKIPSIKCFPLGISGKSEKKIFYQSPLFHSRNSIFSRNTQDKKIEITCITLKDAFELTNVNTINLLKFDIEGSEFEMFDSFREFNKIEIITGELHPSLWKKATLESMLQILRNDYDLTTGGGNYPLLYGVLKK